MARFSFGNPFLNDGSISGDDFFTNSHIANEFDQTQEEKINFDSIFKLEQTNLKFQSSCIVSFQVANNVAIVLIDIGKVLVYNIEGSHNFIHVETIDLIFPTLNSWSVYLDCAGKYFIATYSAKVETYLYRIQPKKSRLLSKLTGVPITCVCWNNKNSSTSFSKIVLVGSKRGEIYECDLDLSDRGTSNLSDSHVHLVFNLRRDISSSEEYHVTGIAVQQIPGSKNSVGVLISTLTRLIYIVGNLTSDSPKFSSFFSKFTDANIFYDSPDSYESGSLVVYLNSPSSFSKIGFVSDKRVGIGNIKGVHATEKNCISDFRILSFSESSKEFPISVLLTEFHCIILYYSRFVAINLIDEGITTNDLIGTFYGTPKGLLQDTNMSRIWFYTSRCVLYYSINNESRNIWKIYMDKNMFEEALSYSGGNNKIIDQILQKKANYLYEQEDYMNSAELYSKTEMPFEEVVLKFSEPAQSDSLILYLENFLSDLNISKHMTQICILSLWITNMLLTKLEDQSNDIDANAIMTRLRSFLRDQNVKTVLKKYKTAFYNLFEQYGNESLMIFSAKLLNDHEKLIDYFLCNEKYPDVLDLIIKNKTDNMIYRYIPILFRFIPKNVIDVLIETKHDFDPRKLILPIIKSDIVNNNEHITHFLTYREYCFEILQTKHQAVHDQYVALLCHLGNENTLVTYLDQSVDNIFFNKQYALRLASKHHMNRASIQILCSMNLYEEALTLSLTVDLNMARICASKPTDVDRKRKLWLTLAKTSINSNMGVEEVMKFIAESQVLKIDDVLGLISDFKNIDSFRDAICESLQHYNKVVENLTRQIEKLSSISERLRYDNSQLKHRSSLIQQQSQCSICGFLLLVRPFYSYPCSHNFHQSCFLKKYFSMSSKYIKKEIFDQLLHLTDGISDQIDQKYHRDKTHSTDERFSYLVDLLESVLTSNYEFSASRLQEKDEIDQMMIKECIYCGELSIKLITKQLVPEHGIYDS